MTLRRTSLIPAACLSAACLSAASGSAQGQAASPAAVGDIARCRAIAGDAERLACFDAAAARLQTAIEKKEVTVLDREGVRRTRRSLFGFSLPRLSLFGGGDDDEADAPEFVELNTTIRRVIPQANGLYTFVLEEGAQWRTTEELRTTPKAGDPVRIRKGALGSYILNVRGTRGAKALRIG